MEQNINLGIESQSLSECLRSTFEFDGQNIVNICDGNSVFVPNGFWDYASAFILFGIGAMIILVLFVVVVRIIFD